MSQGDGPAGSGRKPSVSHGSVGSCVAYLHAAFQTRFPNKTDSYLAIILLIIASAFFLFQLAYISQRLAHPDKVITSDIIEVSEYRTALRLCPVLPAPIVCTLVDYAMDSNYDVQSIVTETSVPTGWDFGAVQKALFKYTKSNITQSYKVSAHQSTDRGIHAGAECCYMNFDKRIRWSPDTSSTVSILAFAFVPNSYLSSERYRFLNNDLYQVRAFQFLYAFFDQPAERQSMFDLGFNKQLDSQISFSSGNTAQLIKFTLEQHKDGDNVQSTYHVAPTYLEPIGVNITSSTDLARDLGLNDSHVVLFDGSIFAPSFLVRQYSEQSNYQFSDWVSNIGGLVSVIITVFGLMFPTTMLFRRHLRFHAVKESTSAPLPLLQKPLLQE